ncbi:hypothetical protein GCK72_017672 [Caenorhabditis remanei]|uniref:Uncharacterized protein n=1 Tax=Caenorhabditis remanei TaxID=31234 RepID=A0A6A5G7Q3_CAERE|nr:hypothetical protein GCK72_017672 [Caenorhabditis remanei]KAF1751118.1 hypothetical protein GCK72_017672 [Caenorhabditis remanei]
MPAIDRTVVVELLLLLSCNLVESPPWDLCPEYQHDFGHCEKLYEKCLEETPELVDCPLDRRICYEQIGVKGEGCKYIVENARKEKNVSLVTRDSVVKYLDSTMMKDLYYTIQDLRCSSLDREYNETLRNVISKRQATGEFVQTKIANAMACNEFIKQKPQIATLKTKLIKSDRDTFHQMPISFDQWRCGWSLGDIARVILRRTALIATPSSAIHFNHCCAIHMDCYYSRKDRTDCDKKFQICTEDVVQSLKGQKSGVRVLKEILTEIIAWDGDAAYEFAKTIVTKYRTYSVEMNSWFTGFSASDSVIYLVLPTRKYEKQDKKMIENAYGSCPLNNIESSSYYTEFINCDIYSDDSQEDCYISLKERFSNMKQVDKKCSDAILEVKKTLGPQEPSWLYSTAKFLLSYLEHVYVKLVLEVIFLISMGWNFYKFVRPHAGRFFCAVFSYCSQCMAARRPSGERPNERDADGPEQVQILNEHL